MTKDDSDSSLSSRVGTITSVNNTLKFFALALLIVEALIGILAVRSDDVELLQSLSLTATGMFVLVVVMVGLLAFYRPRSLLAQKPSDIPEMIKDKEVLKEHLEKTYADIMKELQTPGGIQSLIDTEPIEEDIVIERKGVPKR